MTLRAKLFWMIDAMKGGVQKHHFEDLKEIMENYESPKIQERLYQYLTEELDYATEHIKFYKSYKEYRKLQDFPVINKSIVRDNESLFLDPKFKKEELFKQETSGSTGMPFAVYQDPLKRMRATADTLYFSEIAKYTLGQRLYFSRVWDKETTRSAFTCFKQNWVIHESANLSEEMIEKFLTDLENDHQKKSVIIFASTLAAITKYIETKRGKTTAQVESFITLSESLDPTTKAMAKEQFGCAVISRYSDQELGIMAQQECDSDDFLLNIGSYFFEFLDLDEDKPVEPGKPGRIVVTDLFNRSMPLIRYDTGDVAIQKPTNKGEIPRLLTVEGRRVDYIYSTSGDLISPYVINTPMHEFQDISQYQFIQNGENEYKMLLNLRVGLKEFARERDMVVMLKSFLGSDANIKVEYVEEIPVLKSGKRKQVVNNYKN